MTIPIPDDLTRGLALESPRSHFDAASSPKAVLRSVRGLPHPSAAAVDHLKAEIAAARLPMREQGDLSDGHAMSTERDFRAAMIMIQRRLTLDQPGCRAISG